jgi:general transcription factor 3C polypeptide 5 (transcription factor C subunit 1)
MEDSSDAAEASTSTKSQNCAPAHELPTTHFHSIEYPGYVRPESVSKAIHSLGGQSCIDRAFRRSAPREDSLLELNLRPDNPFSHPLLGDLVPTSNVLLRVVKRKLKRPPNDDDGAQTVGEYTAVATGVIPKTARFRSEQSAAFVDRATPCACLNDSIGGMADFQYQPAQDEPLSKLRGAMATLDGQRPLSPTFHSSHLSFYRNDNSRGHPRIPSPPRNGGLHHRRPICHGRRCRPATRRARAP